MRRLLICAALVICSQPAAAKNFVITDGNDLHGLCTGDTDEGLMCLNYIRGVLAAIDMISNLRKDQRLNVCLPRNATGRQLIDILLAELREHPERRHYDAAVITYGTMHKTFPCPEQE